MIVCFPVLNNKGLESEVYGHFGSAPFFIIVETDNRSVAAVKNNDMHHAHGACNPMKALNNQKIEAVVVGGIGVGALNKLNQLGIKVFKAQAPTVKENLRILVVESLPEFSHQHCCSGHGLKSVCSH